MKSFDKYIGFEAISAGLFGFLYAVAFIVISRNNPAQGVLLSALFLLLTGIFTAKAVVGLYTKLKETHSGFALLGLVFALGGALGMSIHGGYDLANVLNPPVENIPGLLNLPSQVDPRGLLSFGVGALGLFYNSWLIGRTKAFPKNLAYVGYLSSVLLTILYLGRLTILTPTHPVILYSAILNGFVVSPLFYIWLGFVFWKEK